MSDIGLDAVLRRDRLVTAVALSVIAILAWVYVLWFASQMAAMSMSARDAGVRMDVPSLSMPMEMPGSDMVESSPSVAGPAIAPWSAFDAVLLASMWIAMMIGMMAPSAAPMILLYARVGRSATTQGKPFASTAWFAGGYLLAWCAFAVLATGAQWMLEEAALLSPTMTGTSQVVGGIILIGAGLYQWTPLKDSCLGECRAPLDFIQRHGGFQRRGAGALRLGLQHGLYCIGCCWALMALLFVGGVMNPLWIAGIAALVLVEKLTPGAPWIPRLSGAILATAGIWMVFVA